MISRSNVSRPRYSKGSVKVGFRIDKLVHGVPDETDEAALIRIPDDGELEIPWEIHGENLAEPASGVLNLEIQTQLIEGPPITTLAELTGLLKPNRDDDGDEE